ncbi:rhamnulokinase [Lederbergia wuyishanensis]|uniref:Rhamnulokinase n=1 Tax=Lederbergia wuyishanensis TaxID=1347903 RepID=A0ABU0D088_9BACI|nr:rhamnulokinase [Lederbergia wuyishanensis]MCJ8006451.1 rhamnulokinase [Lederbergia wuyishanensis]MDQ0341827.1 rhamnulokinase [Lederbergia wuyishanensis]
MLHIAVDIGASSGRLVAGKVENETLEIQEIHRFSNGFKNRDGTYYWDIDHLLYEILYGLSLVKSMGYEDCTLGIDTWAVDYALVGKDGKRLQDVVSYRDHRTDHSIEKFTKIISKAKIYEKTGIQFLPFNTIYQLYEENKKLLNDANKILMVPDYLGYRLTGKAVTEMTNASTMQLMNIENRTFDMELLDTISVKAEQFGNLVNPGTTLGKLRNDWFPELELPSCTIISVASHDTASAIIGTPGQGNNWAYISSGTWSLLGMELDSPVINEASFVGNYTNEWGAFGTYRFLKNIVGMWILQEVQRNLPEEYSFEELVLEAKQVSAFEQFINFDDQRFLNPENMITEIQAFCIETNQTVPKSAGELAAAVFYNLAIMYAVALQDLESIVGKKIDRLHIVGGGSQNEFLNQLTADLSGKTVFSGPVEATAIGNLLMQLISINNIDSLQDGRILVSKSFEIKEYKPRPKYSTEVIQLFKEKVFKNKSNENDTLKSSS